MSREVTLRYIPKHAHAKAVAWAVKRHGHYILRIVNGITGDLIRTRERKRVAPGLRVMVARYDAVSILYFERTH